MKPSKRPPLAFTTATEEPVAGMASVEIPVLQPAAFGAKAKPVREPAGWPIYLVAFSATVAWAVIAYAVSYQRGAPSLDDPFALTVLVMLAVGPVVLIWVAAYLLHQGVRLAAEARRGRELADTLLAPAALASSEAGSVIEAVRRQIEEASAAATQAREVMASLRGTLATETERLNEAAALSTRTAAETAERLAAERGKLDGLTSGLGAQAAAITGAADRAAEVTAAAGQATDGARTASEDLARHVARLETAGASVGEQMRAVEHELAQQRAALLELAERLRGEQQGFATEADTRISRLGELVAQSRTATAEVSQTAQQGAEAIQHLTAAAAERFNELTQAARLEREALTLAAQGSIGQITAAAQDARRAADSQAEAAQARVELINEAAFEAGKKADAVFEQRLTQARGLIEQSSEMVDLAGEKARQRLEGWMTAARSTITEVERMLASISERAESLPGEAQTRAEALRVSMEQSLGDLLASARTASEETKALDAAFQQRVRANYEMLSEAVRLMGLVAGEPAQKTQAQPQAPVPDPAQPAPSLRRLRLTPVATNEEFRGALETAGAPTPSQESLGWKGLLDSLDRDGADPEHLTQRMVAEIKTMGIDTAALLPKPKIDEIAAAVQTGDASGAVEVVRAIAAAPIERLSARLFADAALRGQAERYRRRFSDMLRDAAERDHQGFLVGSLLASDEGRAWLLLDAAATRRA